MLCPGVSSLEDLDLTGQEDPVVLRALISAMPAQAAYREGEEDAVMCGLGVKKYRYAFLPMPRS